MPCLNEEASVGVCVAKAWEGIRTTGLPGEVIVCDNGSTDKSVLVARAAGARIVHQDQKGYGNAYLKGLEAARGQYLVMGDSDDSYDFRAIPALLEPLLEGSYDYVLGSRFLGTIQKRAMPFAHRYIGNPLLTGVLNRFFGIRSSDAHSGMRAFTKSAFEQMGLRCPGMEFASELVIKSDRVGLRCAEVPIDYAPRIGTTKLSSVRDGWRHLRFMLLLRPQWLFVTPGAVLLALGIVGQLLLLRNDVTLGSQTLSLHWCVLFAMVSILGSQLMLFGLYARLEASRLGVEPRGRLARDAEARFTLRRGFLIGAGLFVGGLAIDGVVLAVWIQRSMGQLNAMRPALLAMTLMVLGLEVVFGSFFLESRNEILAHQDLTRARSAMGTTYVTEAAASSDLVL